jgi:hypothetical protein
MEKAGERTPRLWAITFDYLEILVFYVSLQILAP